MRDRFEQIAAQFAGLAVVLVAGLIDMHALTYIKYNDKQP
ncbi:MAG: hypothetical protein FOGNACKC_00744 [Anaerolineae bacterium]|nr:hypothetical protein [Anaerolineae bacterium]